MAVGSIVSFVVVLGIVLLILKIIGKPIKLLISLLINGIIGFAVLWILKAIGLAVAINVFSAIIVGLLGIPGLILVLILQLGFGMLL